MYEEWVRVDSSYTRVQVAMAVARVFNNFVEVRCLTGWCPFARAHAAAYQKHRSRFRSYGDYPWSLRPDAFYKVWLLGLERVENNVFVADLKYVKDYPNE